MTSPGVMQTCDVTDGTDQKVSARGAPGAFEGEQRGTVRVEAAEDDLALVALLQDHLQTSMTQTCSPKSN